MSKETLDKGFAFIIGERSCVQSVIANFFVEESSGIINLLPNTKYASIRFDDLSVFKSKDYEKIGKENPECEIVLINDSDRYGTNACYYKPAGDVTGIREYLSLHSGYKSLIGPNTRNWLNIFALGKVSYITVDVKLKNGKDLRCTIDGARIPDELDVTEICALNLDYLAELCSKSVPPRSQPKYIREFLKATKVPSNVQKINAESWLYRRNLTPDETKFLSDESIVNYTQTHSVESVKHTFDYDAKIFTTKHSVQVVAMKDPENKKYSLETYNTFSEITQTEMV